MPLTFLDDAGQPTLEKFTIVYRSYSRKGVERLEQELESDKLPNGNIPYSAMFAKLVIAIIDQDGEPLTNETGTPAELTREFFDGLLPADLESIQRGISGDMVVTLLLALRDAATRNERLVPELSTVDLKTYCNVENFEPAEYARDVLQALHHGLCRLDQIKTVLK